MKRKIIHIDMDAFYASVEQREHPELCGKPLAVGREDTRGVVATASYEARKYGVRSAMSVVRARSLCPDLIFIPPHFELYRSVSQQVTAIFRDYTDLIEPLSIDEAFLDVTENKKGISSAEEIATEIRRRIRQELRLTASAGVASSLFLAKIASEQRKPDGLYVVPEEKEQEFIDLLPIESFWGVGKVTARRMHQLGIHTGWHLRQYSLGSLTAEFGKAGRIFYEFARNIDHRRVEPHTERKSVGCEHTLEADKKDRMALLIELYHVAMELLGRLEEAAFSGHTITLKIKYGDFTQHTRSTTFPNEIIRGKERILSLGKQLFREAWEEGRPVRLLGLTISNPADAEESATGSKQIPNNTVETQTAMPSAAGKKKAGNPSLPAHSPKDPELPFSFDEE